MTLTSADQAARDALRARQGAGARYDAAEAPAEDLLLARRATSYFARKLNDLDDAALFEPPARGAGCSRAHVVASISYDARRQALMLEPFCAGKASEPKEMQAEELPPLDLAVTLPARALRHLFNHSAIHLDVCWRDLSGHAWDNQLSDSAGYAITPRDFPHRRAITLWQAAIALGNGARLRDAPSQLHSELTD